MKATTSKSAGRPKSSAPQVKNSKKKPRVRMKRSGAARPWMESREGIGRSYQAPTEVDVSAEELSDVKDHAQSKVKPPIETELPNLPMIAKLISKFGEVYNGFEATGAENIPAKGPALIVFYHGLVPIDAWYFGLQHYLKTGRMIRGLGDRFLFKTPILKDLVNSVGAKEGDPKTAIELLKNGELVGVSPGGVREAIAGTSKNYHLIWGNREGFARLAHEAQVPIIPAFTANIEETYRAPYADTSVLQDLYEKTRLPLVPIIGLGILPFPVKLKTFIGEPIAYDPNRSVKETVRETKEALERMIAMHQPQDTSIFKALKNRFLNPRG